MKLPSIKLYKLIRSLCSFLFVPFRLELKWIFFPLEDNILVFYLNNEISTVFIFEISQSKQHGILLSLSLFLNNSKVN